MRRLRAYPLLADAADLQSDTNALTGETSHFNPLARRATAYDRGWALGINPVAVWENVASTQVRAMGANQRVRIEVGEGGSRNWVNRRTGEPLPWPRYAAMAKRIVQQWMDSPAYRVNILNAESTQMGCGVAMRRTLLGA